MKRKLKKPVQFALYGLVFVSVFASIFSIEKATSPKKIEKKVISYIDEEKEIEPVVAINNVVKRPYSNDNMRILKDYYDYQDEAVEQQNSLIYYENTYLQSNSIAYGNDLDFDVLAILDGTVTKVSEDDLLGVTIEIDHGNEIIGYYRSLKDVSLKKGDVVTQGQVIAKAGTSNMEKDLGNHLTFELAFKGNLVNPENFYEKNISDL
jgi:stage II sporulation protein Q